VTHLASACLRELADKLDALPDSALDCTVEVRVRPSRKNFATLMAHFGITPTIGEPGRPVDRWSQAGGHFELAGQRVDVRNWLGDVGTSVEEQQTVKVWKLPGEAS